MPDLLLPVKAAVSAALAAAHAALAALGADPASALAWIGAIALLVAAVRLALLPLVAHGVRTAHASARARPALEEVRRRYAGRRDPDSLRALAAEQRAVQAEHGVSALGCLPVLAQLPIVFALYAVLADVAGGRAVGAMDAALVASAGSASILGVRLADRWDAVSAAPSHVAVVVGLALASAGLSYASTRWFALPNTVLEGMPEAMVSAQRLMPALSAVGVLVAAGAVPVGLLVYWVATNAWTAGQQFAIARWWPTPGTPAHAALLARRAGR